MSMDKYPSMFSRPIEAGVIHTQKFVQLHPRKYGYKSCNLIDFLARSGFSIPDHGLRNVSISGVIVVLINFRE